jgi:tetratricopeptide (TPR) repeat protein
MTNHINSNRTTEREEFLSLTRAYINQNHHKEALVLAESWLKNYPIDADAHIILCHALLKMGNIERVHEILDNLENMVLQLSRIYNRVGDLCLSGGLVQEAIKFYRKFVSLNPDSPIAKDLSDKIDSLISGTHGTSIGSVDVIQSTIENVPSDFYTTTLAELYMKQGHADMAVEVLSGILNKDPQNVLVANRLNEVRALLNSGIQDEQLLSASYNEGVIQELTRWLKNINRLKQYAS